MTDRLAVRRPETIAGLDLHVLAEYLTVVLAEPPAGALAASMITGGRSNPTYLVWDERRSWVLRRPPFGDYVRSGHDMSREVTAMTALKATVVPVPGIVAFCEDTSVLGAPFYLMEHVEGRTYRTQTDTATLTKEQRSQLAMNIVTILANLHALDPASVGLSDWGSPDDYLQRQVLRWARQWEAAATTDRPEVVEVLRRLSKKMPVTVQRGIVHGDYKIDNIMVDTAQPTTILAVLDWELSTLGDTIADLGLLLSFWDEPDHTPNPITKGATALPGFPSADEMIDAYARLRGVTPDHIDWYVSFADFKVAVLLEQINRRRLDGTTRGAELDDVGTMVAPLLARALLRLG